MKIPVTYVIYRAGISCFTAAVLVLAGLGLAGSGPLHGWHGLTAWILSGF